MVLKYTIAFGHYVAHHSWDRLIQDYNVLAGRIWALVLLAVTAAPFMVYKSTI